MSSSSHQDAQVRVSSADVPGQAVSTHVGRGRRQGVFWSVTVPCAAWETIDAFRLLATSGAVAYVKGQQESAPTTGYLHWQVFAAFPKKVSVQGMEV